jgi:hypothetical protein
MKEVAFLETARKARKPVDTKAAQGKSAIEIIGFDMSGRRPLIKGAPADQGLFCGIAFDRGCGHVFGLLMRVMTPVGPDVVR